MSWSEPQVEAILAQMRVAETAQTGGSRCHATYGFFNGEWVCEAFDEDTPKSTRAARRRSDR